MAQFECYRMNIARAAGGALTVTLDPPMPPGTITTAGDGIGYVLDWSGVKEWAATLESASFTSGVIKIEYRLNPNDAWTDYVASMSVGTRYTHRSTDGTFHEQTGGTFLPVHSVLLEMNTLPNAGLSGVVWLYLYRED